MRCLYSVADGVMQVSIGQHACTGTGPNKKLAKRAAAEGLLQLLGYSRPSAHPVKPSIKTGDTNQDMDKSRKVCMPFSCPVSMFLRRIPRLHL
jgi:hypothetical protein